jgi:hypothetical protein
LNSTLKFPQPKCCASAFCLRLLPSSTLSAPAVCSWRERKLFSVDSHTDEVRGRRNQHRRRPLSSALARFLFESIFSDILIVNFRFHRSNEKSEPEEKFRVEKGKNYQTFSPRSLPLHAMPCHHPRLSPFLPCRGTREGKKKSKAKVVAVFISFFFLFSPVSGVEREAKAGARVCARPGMCCAVLCRAMCSGRIDEGEMWHFNSMRKAKFFQKISLTSPHCMRVRRARRFSLFSRMEKHEIFLRFIFSPSTEIFISKRKKSEIFPPQLSTSR